MTADLPLAVTMRAVRQMLRLVQEQTRLLLLGNIVLMCVLTFHR